MHSLFAWPGGKRNLLKTLLSRIPQHTLYVEVFAGSAKLLLAKEPSKGEIINDLNGDLANFFRVVKHRPAELAELLESELVHPGRFRELRSDVSADELERARTFAYLAWYSYGSKGEHFAHANTKQLSNGQSRRPLDQVRELLELSAQRLRKVGIEQRDFADLIRRHDTPETFFYLDPPYVHFGPLARYDALTPDRRVELFEILSQIQGSYLMSFDDCPEVRSLADRYGMTVESVETSYCLGNTSGSRNRVSELLLKRAA